MNYKHILTTILVMAVFSGTASAWLTGYDHRMAITVNNGGTSNLSYYQFNFTNDTNVLVAAGNMQASGADCRITDASDNLLPFWNETPFNAAGTKIWVNATTLAVGDNTFYMYYGNAGASSVANGTNAFEFFDAFDGGWVKDPANPVLVNSTNASELDSLQLYPGPVIEFNDTHWALYYVGNQVDVGIDRTFLATSLKSDNGHNWVKHTNTTGHPTPVIDVGANGSWDDANAYPGSVMKDGSTWKFWYVGDDGTGSPHYLRVGYATSTDGINWTKDAGNPILTDDGNGTYSQYGIEFVGVVKDNTTYYMALSHYHTNGVDIFSSSDGISWSVLQRDVITDMYITDFIKYNGVFYIYGHAVGDYTYIKTYSATNVSGPYTDRGIQIQASMSGWENRAYIPHILQTGTDEWMLFYAGYNDPDLDVGIATLSNSVPYIQLPDSSKWTDLNSTASVSDGIMTVTPTDGHGICTTSTWDRNVAFRAKMKRDAGDGTRSGFVQGWGTDGIDFLRYYSNDTLEAWSGGNVTNPDGTSGFDTYKIGEITWLTDQARFFVDDVEETNSPITTNVPTGNVPVGFYGTDSSKVYVDWVLVRKYASPEPVATLGAEETGGGGCGAYNITLPSGWSIIGWTNPTASTAHAVGTAIGGNCQYVVERNRTTGNMVYHNMAAPDEDNFAIERGWGYYVSTTAETVWERDS